MTALTTIDARAEQKLAKLMPYLVKEAEGNEDLIQEGAMAVWEAIQREPEATDRYYKTKAKWTPSSRKPGG